VDQAVAALRRGDLAILPTETVYGLAADASNPLAVARIYEAKGRPSFNPLIAHVASLEAAEQLARLDGPARTLAQAFWPGPLTVVAPVRDTSPVCDLARAGLETVAIRVPAHPLARSVLEAFAGAVAAPSANRSGRPSPTTFLDAIDETGAASSVALDGGPCTVGIESTVVAVLNGAVRLLRPGGVTREAIEALVGPLQTAEDDAHRSPGRLALHYAPNAPVRLNVTAPREGEAYLAFADAAPRAGAAPAGVQGAHVFNLSPSGDLREAAANLFAYLRAADRTRPRAIAVAPIPAFGLGEAINDRLRRAAGFVG
jgi:L-threonylcarbamoyladenylate synthase